MLFADLLSLHLVTFLMLFILVDNKPHRTGLAMDHVLTFSAVQHQVQVIRRVIRRLLVIYPQPPTQKLRVRTL